MNKFIMQSDIFSDFCSYLCADLKLLVLDISVKRTEKRIFFLYLSTNFSSMPAIRFYKSKNFLIQQDIIFFQNPFSIPFLGGLSFRDPFFQSFSAAFLPVSHSVGKASPGSRY